MAESTLSLKRSDFIATVGRFLGWDMANEANADRVADIVTSGLRQFYFPPPVENGPAYSWSFLRPLLSTTLAEDKSIIALPDDFGGLEGQITVNEANNLHLPLPQVSEGRVRQAHSEVSAHTGRPLMAAIRPRKGTGKRKGQRFELYVYPSADQDYTLEMTYYLIPNALDGTSEHAYGGAQHAETILESCLAIAEQREDDASGVHSMKFHERLMASIAVDRQKKPQNLGYNGDNSDGGRGLTRAHLRFLNSNITVNGIQYGD